MKRQFLLYLLMIPIWAFSQDMRTVFGDGKVTGGYGALTNKFTTIRGEYANLAGFYGGVFIDRKWMLGVEFVGSTNYLAVPAEYALAPLNDLSYQYSQGGFLIERVLGSNQSIHLVLNLFAGAGHTLQYHRDWEDWDDYDYEEGVYDQNLFFVLEPGAQLEFNLFRWMRLSPGVSYRQTYNSKGLGLADDDLSDWTYSVTLKFGGFGKRSKNKTEVSTY